MLYCISTSVFQKLTLVNRTIARSYDDFADVRVDGKEAERESFRLLGKHPEKGLSQISIRQIAFAIA